MRRSQESLLAELKDKEKWTALQRVGCLDERRRVSFHAE